MRNLKRVLSLSLASIMLLGMMVIGSSAASDYTDVDYNNDNVEAIEVLQAINVMSGDLDNDGNLAGTFRPGDEVKRSEMARIMAFLMDLDYDYYIGVNPFSDMVGHWAEKYAAACAANGIIYGRGDGIYDPDKTVTAVEAASMLMRALGYFQNPAVDQPNGFEIDTIRQAGRINLFNRVDAKTNEPMTRNDVAQLVLNALQSGMVEPSNNSKIDVTVGDAQVSIGSSNYVYTVARDSVVGSAINDTKAERGNSSTGLEGEILDLGEKLYDGKLKLHKYERDVFGRPARQWEFDGKEIGTYAKVELMVDETVGKVTGKDLYDLLGSSVVSGSNQYDVYCFIDGVYTERTGAKTALNSKAANGNAEYYFDVLDMNKDNKAAVGGTGTGTLTQVYKDIENEDVYVVVINTYLARAKKDYDEKKEEVDVTVYAIRKETANLNGEYIKVKQPTPEDETLTLTVEDFPAIVNIEKDDPLLVQVADGEIQTCQPAEVLEGVTISAFQLQSKVVVDGSNYNYTTTAAYKNADDINKNWTNSDDGIFNLKDRTYNVYLDAYGNLIGIEEVEAVKNYVFITGIDLNGSNLANQTADASAIFLDGTMEAIKVNMSKSDWVDTTKTKLTGTGEPLVNTWCTYTVSGDVYTLKEVSRVQADGTGRPNGNTIKLAQYNESWDAPRDEDSKIDAKNYRLHGAGTLGANNDYYSVYGDSDTVYLTAKLGELTTTTVNYGIIKDVVSVTTGIENANLTVWKDSTVPGKANDISDGKTPSVANTSKGVYALYNNEGIIIAAVVVGEDAGTAKDLVYVSSDKMSLESDNGGSAKAAGDGLWTWSREVIRNGEKVTIYEVGDDSHQDNHLYWMKQYHWYQIRTNADGNVIDAIDAKKALTVYDDDNFESGSSQFVTKYEWINDAVERQGVDTVLYITGGGPKDEDDGVGFGSGNKLEVKGNNTLAVTNAEGSGIHFRKDVNVVLQYYNKNVKDMEVWEDEGVDALKDMVDQVNYNSDYRDDAKEEYYWVSALIEDGFATSIVIYDSYNDYTRPESTKTPNGSGNVVNSDSFKTNEKALLNITSNAYINAAGVPVLSFTAYAPDWAAVEATKIEYDLYVNDGYIGAYELDNVSINGTTQKMTVPVQVVNDGYSGVTFLINRLDPADTVRIEITDVEYSHVKATYVDQEGEDITGYLTAGSTAPDTISTDVDTGTEVELQVDSSKFTAVTGATLTGLTGLTNTTEASSVLQDTDGSVDVLNGAKKLATGGSNNYVAALGTGPVEVEITLAGVEPLPITYKATNQGETNIISKGLDTAGITVTGMPDAVYAEGKEDIVITISNDNAEPEEGDDVVWTIKMWDKNASGLIWGYYITYTVGDRSETQKLDYEGGTNAEITVGATVGKKDIDLTVTKIAVWTVDLYAKSAEYDADSATVKVTFSDDLDPGVTKDNITLGGTSAPTVTSAYTNGANVLTIKLSGAIDNADQFMNIDSAVKDAEGHPNKAIQITFDAADDGFDIGGITGNKSLWES